tara:strand:- start:25823 stop:26362 length:540 start_codon:yes stop_codon:yes gene_type:complete
MRFIPIIAGTILLAACATSYQPNNRWTGGGFSEIPIAADAYKVTVKGNGYTSSERTNEMALLRSAELTRDNGFNYFIVVDSEEYQSTSQFVTPGSSTSTTTGSASAYSFGNRAYATGVANTNTTYTPPQIYTTFKPNVAMVVKFVPDEFAKQASALSVAQVFGLYAEKYGLTVNANEAH